MKRFTCTCAQDEVTKKLVGKERSLYGIKNLLEILILRLKYAEVAQLVEHSPEKAGVRSSILRLGTTYTKMKIASRVFWPNRMKLSPLPLLIPGFIQKFSLPLTACLVMLFYLPVYAAEDEKNTLAQVPSEPSSAPTRTVVADLLMIDGSFYVIRGEHGEVRIEVTSETQLSEKFTFGDRIKAVILPDDTALSITRAQPGEPVGMTSGDSSSPPSPSGPSSSPSPEPDTTATPQSSPEEPQESDVRIVIADLLMVDRDLYIVRTEYGEIQIEVTPTTELSETFEFGDRIKARITSQDKALSIVRANPGESPGVRLEKKSGPSTPKAPPSAITPPEEPAAPQKDESSATPSNEPSNIRTIEAEILMVDGDFYVVRGERGEIRIEVTPDTVLSESFKFGDRIKARILPNDTALSIERAQPE
jgi:exosome complex RNA-binding protein Csl4